MSTSVCTNCEDDESKCVRDNCVNCCICARRLRRGVKIMDRRRRVQRALYYRRRAQGAQAESDQALAEVARMVADRNEYMGYLTVARQERDEVKAAARALLVRTKHMRWTENRALEELL